MSGATRSGVPRRVPGRPRAALAPVMGALLLALVLLVAASRVWTQWLWFKQMQYGQVFRTQLASGVLLFVLFGGAMGLFVGVNLDLAHRFRPRTRTAPPSAMLSRTRSILDVRRRLAAVVASLVLGVLSGLSAASHRNQFLAWRHATSFGTRDPWFGKDASFYVFDYPWWRFVCSQALWTVGSALLLVAALHVLAGAASSFQVTTTPRGHTVVSRRPVRLSGPVQAHLSVLCALLMVLYAMSSLLDRYGYAISDNWLFTGMGYTDLHARVVAKDVIAIVSLLCALLFLANAWLRRWVVPAAAVGLMLASSLLIQGIYPAVVQRFDVQPKGPAKERDFIAANITATRHAYGLDDVKVTDGYDAATTATAGQLRADAEALPGIRLIDPQLMAPTFEQLQQVRGYYSFPSVLDVDRYTLNGQFTDAVVAAREIDQSQLPDQSWTNLHTVYTHGYGMVAAYGNRRQANGEPVWISRDIPTTGPLKETQSRIYYGERTNTYAVVGAPAGSAPVELDTPGGGTGAPETRNTYTGKGGVGIGNIWTRALYAIRFADANLLLSTGRVNSASRILYDREPRQRVQEVAPWLTVDSQALPAVVDGRVVWIVDGYTTSASYPNSEQVDLQSATSDATAGTRQTSQPVNYIRNSVKAVVDAEDGTVNLYAWDESDPVLRTWEQVYPGLLLPRAAIGKDLLAHMRYPADLFKVQRQVLGRYHVTNPDTWFQQSDLWEVPTDPVSPSGALEAPNYLSIKWPGDASPVFSQTSVMVPRGRQNMGAYVAVNADAASKDYGRIRVLKLSDEQQVAGPAQTYNAMTTDEVVASKLRPYMMQGSAQAHFGNLLTIPVGGGLLYVSPVYTQQATTDGGYLVLRFVVVRFGEQVGIGSTLQEALDSVFKGDAGASTGEGGTPTTSPSTKGTAAGRQAAAQDLQQAAAAFAAADAALRKGDLATYQKQVAAARAKVAAAQAALR